METLNRNHNKIGVFAIICCILTYFIGYIYPGAVHIVACFFLLPTSFYVFAKTSFVPENRKLLDLKLSALLPVIFLMGSIFYFNLVKAEKNINYYAASVSVLLLGSAFSYSVPKEKRNKLFSLFCWIYSVPFVLLSAIGIIVGLSGKLIVFNKVTASYIGVMNNRLYLIANPNTVGVGACIALCVILYLLLKKGNFFRQAILTVMALAVMCLILLSNCRTGRYASFIPLFFFGLFKMYQWINTDKKFFPLLFGIFFGVALCVGSFFLAKPSQKYLLKTDIAAVAEVKDKTEEDVIADQMAIDSNAIVNDSTKERLELWTKAVTKFIRSPRAWLFGATPAGAISIFNHPEHPEDHFHNGYIGILLSYGVIGLLVFIAFLILLLIQANHLVFTPKAIPQQLRFLPFIILTILAINFTEEMLFTRNMVLETNLFFALCGGLINALSRDLYHADTIDY